MRVPTRLLFVTDYDFPTGGIEQFLFQLVSRLGTRFTCQVLAWSRNVLVPARTDVICVEHGDVRTVWSAFDSADVVLIVTSYNVRILARLALDYLNARHKPIITVLQTSGHSDPEVTVAETQLEWLSRLLAASNTIVAVSDDVATAVRSTLNRAGAHAPVVVVENAARLRVSEQSPRGRTVVGFIGRPQPQKGFPLFERLARTNSDRGLLFVANTVSLPPPQSMPEIKFSYNCTDAELLDFFASLDVLVAPYLRADGLPLALQEALNCGVPIIGFDSPGVGSLLRRHDQIVIEPTYEALEAAVLAWQRGELIAHPPISATVIDWDLQSQRYVELIESAAILRPGSQDQV